MVKQFFRWWFDDSNALIAAIVSLVMFVTSVYFYLR